MALASSLATTVSFLRRSRTRAVGVAAGVALVAGSVTGCSVTAGSAVLIDDISVSEQTVQHDTAAFVAQYATAAVTDAQTAVFNRSQITYQVRHTLIAKGLAAQHIVITDAELTAATAQIDAQQNANLAEQLQLPSSDQAGVIHDLVALDALVKAMPAAGVEIRDVSVTAEGVPAATRDQAVSLRSRYLTDPAAMDAAVQAAGSNGVQKNVYSLITGPAAARADGVFQPSAGQVAILANATGYLVLRTHGRTVSKKPLTQAAFGAATAVNEVFDLGALLTSQYQAGTKISVNPRYGVWDPASVRVVPGNDGL